MCLLMEGQKTSSTRRRCSRSLGSLAQQSVVGETVACPVVLLTGVGPQSPMGEVSLGLP
jgi:hypothetical protein